MNGDDPKRLYEEEILHELLIEELVKPGERDKPHKPGERDKPDKPAKPEPWLVPTSTTTEPRKCGATLEGPGCVCVDEVHGYTVVPTCSGDCSDWAIDEPAVARFDPAPSGCSANVLIIQEGKFTISATHNSPIGLIGVSKEVHAYKVDHTRAENEQLVKSTPLVQPHPFVSIVKPAETADGQCLASDFIVHLRELERGWTMFRNRQQDPAFPGGPVRLQDVGERYLHVQLKLEGTLTDFYEEIDALAWTVNGGAQHALIKNVDFTDTSLKTPLPGETAVDDRVVVMKGLREHTIKMLATNPIDRVGTDWIVVTIDLKEDVRREIARLQRHLAQLLMEQPPQAARILAAQLAIEDTYYAGLQDPCITAKHNWQQPPNFALDLLCQTRTEVRDKDPGPALRPYNLFIMSPANVVTDNQVPWVKRYGASVWRDEQPRKQWWVTPKEYSGTKLDYHEEGLLRGEAEGLAVSNYQCCGHAIGVFGVDIDVPACTIVDRNNRYVTLKARGRPAAIAGYTGKYKWSIVAKPHVNAQATITPAGWTTQASAQMEVDRSGIYTVKVEYEIEGRICHLTHALADTEVAKMPATDLEWQVRRLGRYAPEIGVHQGRPYYQERKAVAVLAADMFLRPVAGGPSDVIGRRFHGAFLTPTEIEIADEVVVRAYFAPGAPNLPPNQYRDYAGPPAVFVDPRAPYQVVVDLRTDRDIYALHLTNLKYKHANRLKGQAVPLSGAYFIPIPPMCQPAASAGTSSTATSSVMIAVSTTTTVTSGPHRQRDLQPLVNLLVYNRDLGLAMPSNALMQVSRAGEQHNLANGNLFLNIPVIDTQGHGISTVLTLSYNSLQATYQQALDFYARLNVVPRAEIERGFCPDPIGRGWTHAYHLYVREYVKPRTPAAQVLDLYLELTGPDGNRLQFRAEGGASGNVEYRPEFECEVWLGSCELAQNLRIVRSGSGSARRYVLTDLHRTKWTFDENGDLIEMAEPHFAGTSTRPLTVRRQGANTVVEDSAGRRTTFTRIPVNDTSYNGSVFIDTPGGTSSRIDIEAGRVKEVWVLNNQVWKFRYRGASAGEAVAALASAITDPRNVECTFDYYEGEAFHEVPKPVARNYWGRLGRAQKATGAAAREHLWRYKAYDPNTIEVVYRDPAGVEFIHTLLLEPLALAKSEYVRQDRDAATGALSGTPNYGQVLAGAPDTLPRQPLRGFRYYQKTKFPDRSWDRHGNETAYGYRNTAGGTGVLLERITTPSGVVLRIEYDADNRRHKVFNPVKPGQDLANAPFVEYLYDALWNIKEKIHPAVPTSAAGDRTRETWAYDPATGKLQTYTDVRGVEWTYGYGEGNRDPSSTGLPTSRRMRKQRQQTEPRDLVWEYTYDARGRATAVYEPLFGRVEKTLEFHVLGPPEKIRIQQIPVDSGGERADELVLHYDPLLQPKYRSSAAGNQSWDYNDHGEVKLITDIGGRTTTFDYTRSGAQLWMQNGGGHRTDYVVDELGRVVRTKPPMPDSRTGERASHGAMETIEYDDANETVTHRVYRIAAAADGPDPARLRFERVERSDRGRFKETRVRHLPGGATVKVVVEEYDEWDKERIVREYDGAVRKRVRTIERDAWGREYKFIERVGTSSRTVENVLNPDGSIHEHRPPRIPTFRPNEIPKTTTLYDDLGRAIETQDSYGRAILKVEIYDYGANPGADGEVAGRYAYVKEFGQDPSAGVDSAGLVFLTRTQYNRRGLPVLKLYEDDAASSRKTERGYDAAGRLVSEKAEHGVTNSFLFDGHGQLRETKTETKQKRANIAWSNFDPANAAHTETIEQRVFYEYAWNGEVRQILERGLTETRDYDKLGRLMRTTRDVTGSGSREEETTYDTTGRILRRFLPGNVKHEFEHRNAERAVVSRYTAPGKRLQTRAVYDWEERLVDYRHTSVLYNRIYLKYEYSDFGRIKRKEYRALGSNELIAFVEYGHNAADLRTRMLVDVKRNSGRYRRETTYEYDGNLRLVRLNSGGAYAFGYNAAGYLKKLGRPYLGYQNTPYTNATTYEHDARGRLLGMTEWARNEADTRLLSTIRLHYGARMRAAWERPGAFEPAALDFIPPTASAVRGVQYTRQFSGARPAEITQDLAYLTGGVPYASVTRYNEAARVKVDSRRSRVEAASGEQVSDRTYRVYTPATGLYTELEYREVTNRLPTMPEIVRSRRGQRLPLLPRRAPGGWLQDYRYDGQMNLTRQFFVEEEIQNATGPQETPRAFQTQRIYEHDVLGRMTLLKDRAELRSGVDRFEPEDDVPDAQESMDIESSHQYGPDGEEVFRSVRYYDMQGGVGVALDADTIIVRDGPSVVAEYDYGGSRLRAYDIIPGLNVRLSALAAFDDTTTTSTLYYRWDHRGATLYLTDWIGGVVLDFLYSAPTGERDLFGEAARPVAVGGAPAGDRRTVEMYAFYVPSGMSLDIGMAQCGRLEAAAMDVTAYATGAAAVGGKNDYGYTSGYPYLFLSADQTLRYPASWTAGQQVGQFATDFIRGVGDTLSFGLSKSLREYFWGRYGEVLDRGAYFGGVAGGFVIAVVITGGAAAPGAASAGATAWGARAAVAYSVLARAAGIANFVRSAATGHLRWVDVISMVPVAGRAGHVVSAIVGIDAAAQIVSAATAPPMSALEIDPEMPAGYSNPPLSPQRVVIARQVADRARARQARPPAHVVPTHPATPQGLHIGTIPDIAHNMPPGMAPTPVNIGQQIEQWVRLVVANRFGIRFSLKPSPSSPGPDGEVTALLDNIKAGFQIMEVKPANMRAVRKALSQFDNWAVKRALDGQRGAIVVYEPIPGTNGFNLYLHSVHTL